MWGAKLNSGYRKEWSKALTDLVNAGKIAGAKNLDQKSLAGIVWPLVQREGASWFCDLFNWKNLIAIL
jgi:hypothetical protein